MVASSITITTVGYVFIRCYVRRRRRDRSRAFRGRGEQDLEEPHERLLTASADDYQPLVARGGRGGGPGGDASGGRGRSTFDEEEDDDPPMHELLGPASGAGGAAGASGARFPAFARPRDAPFRDNQMQVLVRRTQPPAFQNAPASTRVAGVATNGPAAGANAAAAAAGVLSDPSRQLESGLAGDTDSIASGNSFRLPLGNEPLGVSALGGPTSSSNAQEPNGATANPYAGRRLQDPPPPAAPTLSLLD